MSELTYTQCGDYLIPNLALKNTEERPLGKYGSLRWDYLKEHRPGLWNRLAISEKLYPHLWEIDEKANERLDQLMPKLAEEAGATAELKMKDPLKWAGLMNTCKAQAEEIIYAELIYC